VPSSRREIVASLLRAGRKPTAIARGALQAGANQKVSELAWLLRKVEGIDARVVLEIGTLSGGTLWAWARVADPRATIVSIDLPGAELGVAPEDEQEQISQIEAYGLPGQSVSLVRGDSHAASTLERVRGIVGASPVDFLFIDGDHTYDGVAADFELYGPLVRPGGLIAFHDIVNHPSFPTAAVEEFWGRARVGRDVEEVRSRHCGPGYGIGVIKVARNGPTP
jgi:predicted O-methyltransferase YrrM